MDKKIVPTKGKVFHTPISKAVRQDSLGVIEDSLANPLCANPGSSSTIDMFELNNEPMHGVDLPDKKPETYRNQFILEDFLYKNGCNIVLDWGNSNLTFVVLIESKFPSGKTVRKDDGDIVGLSAVIKYKPGSASKVHICLVFVIERLRRNGLGTKMLTHIASMYPRSTITLSVAFEQADVLKFYMDKGNAKLTSVDAKKKLFVLSLDNIKLFSDIPLPRIEI